MAAAAGDDRDQDGARTISPRGKPSAAKSAAITKAIIETATAIFLHEGYEGTSMEAVAAAVGIPKRTLYKRFPGKRELLEAVLVERVETWGSITSQQNGRPAGDLGQRLKRHVTTILLWSTKAEVRAFRKLIASACGMSGETYSPYAFYGRRRMTEVIADAIAECGPAQGFHTSQPFQIAEILMALVSGWLDLKGDAVAVTEAAAAIEADLLVSVVLHGKDAW